MVIHDYFSYVTLYMKFNKLIFLCILGKENLHFSLIQHTCFSNFAYMVSFNKQHGYVLVLSLVVNIL